MKAAAMINIHIAVLVVVVLAKHMRKANAHIVKSAMSTVDAVQVI